MKIDELRKGLLAAGHKIVDNTISGRELENVESELDESVGIDDARMKVLQMKAKSALKSGRTSMKMVSLRLDPKTIENMKKKAAELGMPYQAVARKVLQSAFS